MNIDFAGELRDAPGVVCAVSGGADSMCLLHLLSSLGCRVCAAHYEHGIRGEEALRDAAFVEGFCRERGIPCVIEHGDVPAWAAAEGLGLEEAARTLRYDFLQRTAEARGATLIATAHTRDDQAETLLLRLARGTGSAGLRGIPARRGNIVRPLLSVSRREIVAYLLENGIPHVEDSTNSDEAYSRNLIRRRVVPALLELNPRFPEAAARTAALAARDEEYLTARAADFLAAHPLDDGMDAAALRALHPAVSSRVLRLLAPGLTLFHTEQALAFLEGADPALLELPGLTLRLERGRLYLGRDEGDALPDRPLIPGQRLALPEAGLVLESEICRYAGEVNDLFKTSFIKYEMIVPDLLCTGRRPGDRLHPQGRGCGKSLKALLTERGVPLGERRRIPVIRDALGPLLVYGLAADERAKAEPGEQVLKISFRPLEASMQEIQT